MEYYKLLSDSVKSIGFNLNKEMADRFEAYYQLLIQWNEKVNLTAITSKEDIYKKHFIDSIKAFSFKKLGEVNSIIDVGTGAGLPGIPLKIICPDLQITLVDSLNKRVNFLNECIEKLELKDICAIHGRAEDLAVDIKLREKFDVVISRAVAPLPVLAELCLGFAKVGGYFVSLKGPSIIEEMESSEKAISVMGGKIQELIEVEVEETDLEHKLLVIKKIKHTPSGFPRRAGTAAKNPLK